MKKNARVLIMGRPNVGKSTLINRIIGKKKAITYDEPGVTRDLVEYPVEWLDKSFTLVDSGGILLEKNTSKLQKDIDRLVVQSLDVVDHILLITDSQTGVHPTDQDISKRLRPYQDKVTVVANKCDNWENKGAIDNFYQLGLGAPAPVSALHGLGVGDLLDVVCEQIPDVAKKVDDDQIHVALVGRPNVGKSSLINALIKEELVLVGDKAGTTRDTYEVSFFAHSKHYVFVDTAGLRRKAKAKESVEFFSTVRTKKAIETADIVLFLSEPDEFLCDQDMKILNQILQYNRSLIVVLNKWDETSRTDDKRSEYQKYIVSKYPQLAFYPFLVASATERHNLGKLLGTLPQLIEHASYRVPTAELNKFIENLIAQYPPPSKRGKHLNLFYATQAETSPPTFIFFVNHPSLVGDDYLRFMERKIREHLYPFEGVPIRLFFKGRKKVELS